MSADTTHAGPETPAFLKALDPVLSRLEDENHRPNCTLLFMILAGFTLIEIAWASTMPFTDWSIKPDQIQSWSRFARQVVAEAEKDKEAHHLHKVYEARKAAGEKVPAEEVPRADQLAPSGRPGARILRFVGPEGERLFRKAAKGDPKDPSSGLSQQEKAKLAKLINDKVIGSLAFYHPTAFEDVEVGAALVHKISGLRKAGGKQAVAKFLGEASLENLNRAFLIEAYKGIIPMAPLSAALVIGLICFALLKALAVAEYFMHVKFEGVWLRILMLPSMAMVFIIISFLMPDVGGFSKDTFLKANLPAMVGIIFLAMGTIRFLMRWVDMSENAPAH